MYTRFHGRESSGWICTHRLLEMSRINSLVPPVWLDTHTMAFKLKRYKLIIEKINLPPEEGRAGDTEQSKHSAVSSMLCTSG